MNLCCGGKIIDISVSVAPTYIGTPVMHIRVCLMIDMLSAIFIHKSFSQETFSKFVCVLFFYYYFVVFHNIILAARSNSWLHWYWYRSFSHVVFGLPARFFLSVGLFKDFDYFSLWSFNWYLITRGVQFKISWSTLNSSFNCLKLVRINSNKFLLRGTILLNLSVNIMHMLVT